MKSGIYGVIVCFVATSLSGCGTVMNGSTQTIGITSIPTGAKVVVDNKTVGVTPVLTDLSRKEGHIVSIEMPGYKLVGLVVSKGTSGF